MEYLPTFTQHKSPSFVGKYSSTMVPWFADGIGYQHPHYIYITVASQYWNIYIYTWSFAKLIDFGFGVEISTIKRIQVYIYIYSGII
jgi:hypothetical protein